MKRMVFHLMPKKDGRWLLQLNGRHVAILDTKTGALREGKVRCQAAARLGVVAQLMLHDENGNFEIHSSYGDELQSAN